ncbi:MAG: hypothetical protein E7474_01090 [Ruminococcaceae bacterium]|nr:hypothetical protein [Oscillospiraceae bacterium]
MEAAAVAGTDNIPEDRRLWEAVELLPPLAEQGSMFERVESEARALLTAEDEARPGLLLDLLALVTATERLSAVTDVPGELKPMRGGSGSRVRAPYSRLAPLIDALEGSGRGRLSIIEDAWQNHPEDFGDYRVLPHLVDALGDPNEEMEELAATILTKLDSRAIHFLKDGFQPDGRRAMARRVYWVARLTGARENEWLLSILPESRGEVREAVIGALGVSQDNAPLLIELFHTEEGKCRDAALRALSYMDDEESRALWTQELEASADCPTCLEGVESTLGGEMAAKALHDVFNEALARKSKDCTRAEMLTLAHAIYAAYGKCSGALHNEWIALARQMNALEKIRPTRASGGWDLTAAEMLEKCLLETVLWTPRESVRALVEELAALKPGHFLGAAVLWSLLTQGEEAFNRYGKYIVKNGILRRESSAERANRIQIMRALAAVRYDKFEGWHISFSRKDALTGMTVGRVYHLPSFDSRWAEALSDPKVNQDGAVFDLENPWVMKKQIFRMEWITLPMDAAPPEE